MEDEKLYLKFKYSDLVESWPRQMTLFSLIKGEVALTCLCHWDTVAPILVPAISCVHSTTLCKLMRKSHIYMQPKQLIWTHTSWDLKALFPGNKIKTFG